MNILNIGYQKRDFDFVDYNLYSIKDYNTEKSFVFRGPAPSTLDRGSYFTSLGAAFTYGCYTNKPYTQLLSDVFNFPSVNLGIQGGGPSHYTNPENKFLLDLINNSKFVVIGMMSARSCSNSLFKVNPQCQEKLSLVEEDEFKPAHIQYQWLLENHDEDYVKKIIAETKDNFVKHYIELLSQIKVPKILFWFSKRSPDHQEKYNEDVWALLGKFPHFVNCSMVDTIKSYCDEYVECVTKLGTPQILFNRFTGQIGTVHKNSDYGYSSSSYNKYYASPEMHLDAANALLKPVSKYITNSDSVATHQIKHFIQCKDLFDHLKEIHFDKLLLSTKPEDFVLAELELKNHLFYNYEKVSNNFITPFELANIASLSYDNFRSYINLTINYRNENKKISKLIESKAAFLDFTYDLVPYLLSKPSKVNIKSLIEKNSKKHNPELSYAVLCTPRSGSSFLCDLLNTNIGGKSLEHLRPPLLYLIKNRHHLNLNLEQLFNRILNYGTENKIFGTKIISHFLFDLIDNLKDDELNKLLDHFRKFKIIYLYRQDKYAQAISKYLASKSKFWHAKSDNRSLEDYQQKIKDIDYDFETIKSIYETFVDEDRKLENLINSLDFQSVIRVQYENFKKSPQEELARIATFLNISEKLDLVTESQYKVLSSSYTNELISQFKKDYMATKKS